MDRFDRLRTFITVAEQGSFAAAAQTLRVSPASASRAVAALEAELGLLLLRRTTRSVRPTDDGAAFLERCRHALSELDDAFLAVRGKASKPRGLFVVAAPVVFGRMHVAPAVTELLLRHPELDVRLTLSDRLVRLAEEGVDAALRIAELPDSALRAVRLGEIRRVLVAAPSYLAERGRPTMVEDLAQHDLIAFDAPSGEWRFESGAVRLQPRLSTDSVDASVEAALGGLGIARVLSYQVAGHVAEKRLVTLLDEHAPSSLPLSVVFQANRQRSPNLRAFVEAMRERVKSQLE